MSDRFILPGFRSTPAERSMAIALLNSVKLTIEQFEEGWAVYEATLLRVMKEGLPREAPMGALEDYCAGEGLLRADLAAAAIYARADPIVDARSGGVDLKIDHHETYLRCILEPIDANALDYPALGDEDLEEFLAEAL